MKIGLEILSDFSFIAYVIVLVIVYIIVITISAKQLYKPKKISSEAINKSILLLFIVATILGIIGYLIFHFIILKLD